MSHAYGRGARGFVVAKLQEHLGVAADGIFGKHTEAKVKAAQTLMGMAVTGQADAALFAGIGASWPSDFTRAINLVSRFEGTSFGDCNLRDIDGAGLTLGIAGFTTAHGEVQMLLRNYLLSRPGALDDFPSELKNLFQKLNISGGTAKQWHALFYGSDGNVRVAWRMRFKLWGRCALWQALQLDMARRRFWEPALETARSLGFASLQAQCFFLDVAVQNGGWRKSHLVVSKRMIDWHSDEEPRALQAAARAVAACAKERWRNDVLSRKMTLATGTGTVHGLTFDLAAYGVTPRSAVTGQISGR